MKNFFIFLQLHSEILFTFTALFGLFLSHFLKAVIMHLCAFYQKHIVFHYFLVEILTVLLFIFLVFHFGFTLKTVAALILTAFLIPIVFIDFHTQLIPDLLTFPLLSIGLLGNLLHI